MKDEMDTEIRRIFLRFIVLKIINDRPTHGYDIIRTIERRSGGRWTPSAGSIYPILEGLEKNGFIQSQEADRRKVYAITPRGEAALERMVEKKRQLLEELSRVIDYVTGSSDDYGEGDLGARGPGPDAVHDGGAGRPDKNEVRRY